MVKIISPIGWQVRMGSGGFCGGCWRGWIGNDVGDIGTVAAGCGLRLAHVWISAFQRGFIDSVE